MKIQVIFNVSINIQIFFVFLEQLCLPLAHTRPPTSKQLDYIGEIIDEFVFCEIDHKGAKRKVFSFCIMVYYYLTALIIL